MTWDGAPSGCPGPSLAGELWTFVPAPGYGLLVPTKTLIPVSPSLDLARLAVPVQGHQGHWGRASSWPRAGAEKGDWSSLWEESSQLLRWLEEAVLPKCGACVRHSNGTCCVDE